MQPKYSYDDWFSGKVNIIGEEILDTKNSIIVNLSEFSLEDQNAINLKTP